MHQILVLYNPPKNPQQFRDHYVKTHIPLCRKLPGLKAFRYAFEPGALLGAKSPYFCVAELDFADAAAMGAAMGSPQGKAVVDDLKNFASGGALPLNFDLDRYK